jgi:D-sedoheptulose 7-phosphate isomerase
MQDIIKNHISQGIEVRKEILEKHIDSIRNAANILIKSLQNGNKLLFCGNGGSAADAQHIAAELLIRYKGNHNRPSLPAISLAADSSVITAAGNDFGADQIFSRQIEGLGFSGDTLIAITTSGNSPNIIKAILAAKNKEMNVVLLSGGEGGGVIMKNHANSVDVSLIVPAKETAHIQELHIMIGHILCALIEKEMFHLG